MITGIRQGHYIIALNPVLGAFIRTTKMSRLTQQPKVKLVQSRILAGLICEISANLWSIGVLVHVVRRLLC